jgi:hypothetical protein
MSFLLCLPGAASPLVTGNGFGLAVVSPDTAALTKFYAHPYSFSRPDPNRPLSEGVETANFIKKLAWSDSPTGNTSAEYLEDSQIIHLHSGAGDGFFFMPFGLARTVLVVTWEPSVTDGSHGYLQVEWNRSVSAQKVIRISGIEVQLLRFEGIAESLLLVPLERRRAKSARARLCFTWQDSL